MVYVMSRDADTYHIPDRAPRSSRARRLGCLGGLSMFVGFWMGTVDIFCAWSLFRLYAPPILRGSQAIPILVAILGIALFIGGMVMLGMSSDRSGDR